MLKRTVSTRGPLQKKVVERWPIKKIAEKRYREFVEPSLEILKKMAKTLTKNPALEEDLVQQAVIKIVANSKKWKPGMASKKLYAIEIGKRHMRDILKFEKNRENLHFEEVCEDFLSIYGDRRQLTPAENILKTNRKAILEKIKQYLDKTKLSQKTKDIFSYWLNNGKTRTYNKTAAHFKIPLGTAQSRIFSARKALKKAIVKNSKNQISK